MIIWVFVSWTRYGGLFMETCLQFCSFADLTCNVKITRHQHHCKKRWYFSPSDIPASQNYWANKMVRGDVHSLRHYLHYNTSLNTKYVSNPFLQALSSPKCIFTLHYIVCLSSCVPVEDTTDSFKRFHVNNRHHLVRPLCVSSCCCTASLRGQQRNACCILHVDSQQWHDLGVTHRPIIWWGGDPRANQGPFSV